MLPLASFLPRRFRLIAAIVTLATLVVPALHAQYPGWTFIGPHAGDGVTAFFADSAGTIYAADKRYFGWRSTDQGRSWTQITGEITVLAAGTAGVVYASPRGDSSFVRSTDGGETWTTLYDDTWSPAIPIVFSMLPIADGSVIVHRPQRNSDIAAELVVIDAAGAITTVLPTAPPGYILRAASSAGSLFATNRDTLLRSSDGGASWTAIIRTEQPRWIGHARDGTLVLAGAAGSVWRSTDDGLSWQLRGRPVFWSLGIFSIAFDGVSTLYAGARDTLWRSNDLGESWQIVSSDFYQSLLVTATDVLGAGRPFTVSRSSDRGVSWTSSALGIFGQRPGRVIVTGDTAAYIEVLGLRGFRALRDGALWTYGTGAGADLSTNGSADGRLAAYSRNTRRLYYSLDAGATWDSSAPVGPSWGLHMEFDREGGIITTAGGTLRTTDLGASWIPLDTLTPYRLRTTVRLDSSGALYGMGDSGVVRYEASVGVWEKTPTTPAIPRWRIEPPSLLTMPDGTIVIADHNGPVHRSTDRGATWLQLERPDTAIIQLAVDRVGTLVALSKKGRIYISHDRATTWSELEDVPDDVRWIDIAPNGRLYGCTYLGVFRTDATLASVATRATRRATIAISPNPARGEARIDVTLDRPADVHVDIVSASGKLMSSSPRQRLHAGLQRIELDFDGFAAGVYFVRVIVGDRVEVARVVVE